jgi:hypothetical protein
MRVNHRCTHIWITKKPVESFGGQISAVGTGKGLTDFGAVTRLSDPSQKKERIKQFFSS